MAKASPLAVGIVRQYYAWLKRENVTIEVQAPLNLTPGFVYTYTVFVPDSDQDDTTWMKKPIVGCWRSP